MKNALFIGAGHKIAVIMLEVKNRFGGRIRK